MQLSPRYDGPPVLRFAGPVTDPSGLLVRQRRRLGELLATLDEEQWTAASRCEKWTVRDVVAHLIGTDQYWFVSASAALDGAPTRYLDGFDPVATPAAMLDGMQHLSSAEILSTYRQGSEVLGDLLTGLDEDQWSLPAEAPPGHIPLHVMAHHAVWDAWIHERDIALPLGVDQIEEPDEVLACLRYAAVLGPALFAALGTNRTGRFAIDGTEPEVHLVVEVGDPVVVTETDGDADGDGARLHGRTVDLLEALSQRAPFPNDLADADRWMLGGLATAFDQA